MVWGGEVCGVVLGGGVECDIAIEPKKKWQGATWIAEQGVNGCCC